ncbi:hypothetical protein CLOSTMETH_02409 [[Clostridium] methylpentosum DSM 5476]|uniref:Uncharacterized protein n=1 Tax=[Clostridium] methylpentosum DSM 5476 TaxID=537013 RepID=C0EEX0_9FIRM|nr:hypothetical protein CLOSTMETH_02409 [[Clostridium] methylpentosum DSM 5476]
MLQRLQKRLKSSNRLIYSFLHYTIPVCKNQVQFLNCVFLFGAFRFRAAT